jgi:hypothetical protein
MDSVREPLMLLDGDLRVRRVNASFEHEFGDGVVKPTGQQLDRFGKRLNASDLAKVLKEAWFAQTSIDEVTIPAVDGARPLQISARLVPGPGGKATAIMVRLRKEEPA